MLLFKKLAKRTISPAKIQLQLGQSPHLYQREKSKSISPQKQEHRKVYTISPAKIQLQLGESPPQYQREKSKSISPQKQEHRRVNSISPLYKGEMKRSYSMSISPPKRRDSNKPYTSHDLREGINDYYKQKYYKQEHSNKPKINWKTKIGMLTNSLKKTLGRNLFTKEKPVFLDLGESPPLKNEQTFVQQNSLTNKYKNVRTSIGGKKFTKPVRKPNKQKKIKK
jgi:hypothetical protein